MDYRYLPTIALLITFLLSIAFVPGGRLFQQNSLKTSVVSAQTIPLGDGLMGTYNTVWNGTGTSKTQIDPRIYFPQTPGDTAFGINYHDPKIRWEGQIYAEGGTGNYTFFFTYDDSLHVWVNGTDIFYGPSCCADSNNPAASREISLLEKHRYDIVIEFFDNGWFGYVTMEWRGPGVSRQIVPQRVLYSTRAQCSDSIDNDNDGRTDFGNDAGCLSAHDNAESRCGNNLKESENQEVCDGTDLAGKPCASEKGSGWTGTISCANDCRSFNTSSCSAPYVPPAPQCSDGQDNDLDGPADYPSDASCSSATDNDESSPVQCADTKDNDSDGKTDTQDTGCSGPTDNNESDNPQCDDNVNNDADTWTDFPDDPGCEFQLDETESPNPQCSDAIDNDLDGDIDFPGDRGCENINDNVEQNVPVDRNIAIQKGGDPTIIFQPKLGLDERLIVTNPCPSTCLIQTFPDHQNYIGGEAIANDPFTIIAAVLDNTDNSISYTVIAVGDYEEHTSLFRSSGLEYVGGIK